MAIPKGKSIVTTKTLQQGGETVIDFSEDPIYYFYCKNVGENQVRINFDKSGGIDINPDQVLAFKVHEFYPFKGSLKADFLGEGLGVLQVLVVQIIEK